MLVLLKRSHGMGEGDADVAKTRQAPKQGALKLGLVEGSERRMAIDAAGKLRLHQRLAARIDMANRRVLHQTRLDLVKKPNLIEEAKGLRVIGDGARQPEQASIALEDRNPKPGRAEKIGGHQTDRASPDNRDLALRYALGCPYLPFPIIAASSTPQIAAASSDFMLRLYVILTILSI